MEIFSKTDQRLPKIQNVDVFNFFKESLAKEKFKKFEKRKDIKILLDIKDKYYKISENHLETRKKEKSKEKLNDKSYPYPYYELKNGKNLFELNEKEIAIIDNIYELCFKYQKNLDFNRLSFFPNLNKLESTFTEINFPQKIRKANFFKSLTYLDLSFNNLTKSVFDVLKEIKSLKYLFLSGNKLTSDIPDISNLSNLEEIDFSYNQISSHFLNLEFTNNEQLVEIFKNIQENANEKFKFDPIHSEQEKETGIKISSSTSETAFSSQPFSGVNYNYGYEELNKILKTNVQEFFHNLANLTMLKKLNLSHNKIHFFDVDPIRLHKEKGFHKLKNLNISFNLIAEEIAIILVVNIPKLRRIEISHNPIVLNKQAYENIEFEIFKNKNILLINNKNKEENFTFFKNKKGLDRNLQEVEKFSYKVKNVDIVDVNKFSQSVRQVVGKKSKYFAKIKKEIEDYQSETLEDRKDEKIVEEVLESKSLIRKNSSLFITKADEDSEEKGDPIQRKEKYSNSCESYDEFLNLARVCYGKEKHYKKTLPIVGAYHRLRYLLNNLQTSSQEEFGKANYMKPTRSIINQHLDNSR